MLNATSSWPLAVLLSTMSVALRAENASVAIALSKTGGLSKRQDITGSGTPKRRATLRATAASAGFQPARSNGGAYHGRS
jgi:hypothetical protein